MAGSSFGTVFRITTWGESHGPAIGVTVDGCPAGLPLSSGDLSPMMARRRPGGGKMSTARTESDDVEILSGVFEGRTTGAPIQLLIRNTDKRSGDYDSIKDSYRPGHADHTFDMKYGIRDHRGGGRSSGRETAARVAAGAIAAKVLALAGISFDTDLTRISGTDAKEASGLVDEARSAGDSLGSEVRCVISGVPAGIGDPVFDKLDARLAGALFSIGAVKAVQIGSGTEASRSRGSINNDEMRMIDDTPGFLSNNAGGILGGISTGQDIVITVSFKPTPSISMPQRTVTSSGEDTVIEIRGRHDPLIGGRGAVVVEAMAAITLLDAMLLNMSARIDSFTSFYNKGGI